MYERAIASTEALPGGSKGDDFPIPADLLIDVSRLIWRVWTGRSISSWPSPPMMA